MRYRSRTLLLLDDLYPGQANSCSCRRRGLRRLQRLNELSFIASLVPTSLRRRCYEPASKTGGDKRMGEDFKSNASLACRGCMRIANGPCTTRVERAIIEPKSCSSSSAWLSFAIA